PWLPWPPHGAGTRQLSGLETVQRSTPKRLGFESLLKALPLWQDRSGSTTAIPSTVGLPPNWMERQRRRSSSNGAFATNIAPHSQLGWAPILSRKRKRLLA